MSREVPITEPEAVQELLVMFKVVAKLMARAQEPDWIEVDEGSAMAADDRLCSPFAVSNLAGQQLLLALECLHSLRALIMDAREIRPSVPFILTRSAIEATGYAMWILTPSVRLDRVLRCLSLVEKDAKDQHKFVRSAMGPAELRELDSLPNPREVADRAGVGPFVPVVVTDILRNLTVSTDRSFDMLAAWQLGSGFAHGRPWATLAALHLDELGRDGNGVMTIRTRTDFKTIRFLIGVSTAALWESVSRFDLLRRRHR